MKIFNSNGMMLAEISPSRIRTIGEITTLRAINFSKINLSQAILKDLHFAVGNFDRARLPGSLIKSVRFEGSLMFDGDFCGASVEDSEFYDVQAIGATFSCSLLRRSRFLGANLAEVNFSEAMFDDVFFGKDNISHKTNLSGADLSGVDLGKTVFDGVEYDASTRFPLNFDPRSCSGLNLLQE